jgi:hypothetical protein
MKTSRGMRALTEVDRSRQAALAALRAAAGGSRGDRLSDRFVGQVVEIAYVHQFSPDDRAEARRQLRDAVVRESQSHGETA